MTEGTILKVAAVKVGPLDVWTNSFQGGAETWFNVGVNWRENVGEVATTLGDLRRIRVRTQVRG